jgi:hypothetical protein
MFLIDVENVEFDPFWRINFGAMLLIIIRKCLTNEKGRECLSILPCGFKPTFHLVTFGNSTCTISLMNSGLYDT